ncbi:uncharacterized protein VP01_2561g4 [Puccinia sorghi]|uniref:Uncharacterized protein n=1 Tax=Puccinia sorghi TaxID=27349 RepID=A0A0L6V528_9BASI|nr:uncharacterized protein VP01_2561g4 [Puccinia sorghi]
MVPTSNKTIQRSNKSLILLANNGIAAVNEICSVGKWLYGNSGRARAIKFVITALPKDLKISADNH